MDQILYFTRQEAVGFMHEHVPALQLSQATTLLRSANAANTYHFSWVGIGLTHTCLHTC